MPMQQHNKAIRSAHAMIGMLDPEEPESTEPELAWEPEESPEVREPAEPEVKDSNDAEESPPTPDEESYGPTVVVGAAVGAAVSFALTTGATGSGSGVVVAKAATMPPAAAAAAAAAPTPMPIFSGSVKPLLTGATGAGVIVAAGTLGVVVGRGLTTGAIVAF